MNEQEFKDRIFNPPMDMLSEMAGVHKARSAMTITEKYNNALRNLTCAYIDEINKLGPEKASLTLDITVDVVKQGARADAMFLVVDAGCSMRVKP